MPNDYVPTTLALRVTMGDFAILPALTRRGTVPFLVCCAVGWMAASNAAAQLPATRLDGVFPAGGGPGSKFDLTVSGADLYSLSKLHFSHPGITAEVKMAEPGPFDTGPQRVPNQFVVTVSADVPPGQYDVRTEGMYGISNARIFEVGTLPEQLEVEPNNELEQATEAKSPVVFNGQINSTADVDWIRFQATAGERMLVDCLAQRIDSRLHPVVRVVDSNGHTIGQATNNDAGDAIVDFTAPTTGEYFASVRDALFAGGPGYVYRLQIGQLSHIDFIFPPAGVAGSQQQYTIYGRNLPGGQPSTLTIDGRTIDQLAVGIAIHGDVIDKLEWSQRVHPHQSGLDGIEYRVTGQQGRSNPMRLTVATAPVVIEQEPNSKPAQAQQLSIPCEVAGQFYPVRDADWFSFTAKQAEVISMEVYSHRLGLPTDPTLVVQQITTNEKGEEQQSLITQVIDDTANRDGGHEFDTRSGDPKFRFVAPADGTYRVYLRDGFSALKSDPRLVYRLALRREQPDFRLAAVPADSSGALFLRKGGRESIHVVAFRQDGFAGDIRLTATNLPAGITASEVSIGPQSNVGTLVITADENAAPAAGSIQIAGKAVINGQEVTRTARTGAASVAPQQIPQPGQLMPGLPARLTRGILVSISAAESAGVTAAAGNNQIWETARGGILKIPYTVVRRNGFNGGIIGMPMDIPANIDAQQVNVGGGATTGEVQLNLRANTPIGTYTFFVNNFVQGYEYRRNPDAAQAAAARKTQLDQIVNETAEKARRATEAADQAQRTMDEMIAALQTATNDKDAADRVAAETTDPAQKATAIEAITVAEKAVTDAMEKLKVAEENKAKADEEAKKAMELSELAMQTRQKAEERANELANEAQPRQLNYWTPSTPIQIRIAEYPITLEGIPESVTVKQGAMIEVPLKINRLFGFDQNVDVQTTLPAGVGGVQINGLDIPNGQADGKIVIMAAADATPGTHVLQIVTRMNFNGNGLEMPRTMKLVVEAVTEMK